MAELLQQNAQNVRAAGQLQGGVGLQERPGQCAGAPRRMRVEMTASGHVVYCVREQAFFLNCEKPCEKQITIRNKNAFRNPLIRLLRGQVACAKLLTRGCVDLN